MWNVIENGELVPLSTVNARAKCDELLSGHDVTHGGTEFPFCEDYGCSCIVEIRNALDAKVTLIE